MEKKQMKEPEIEDEEPKILKTGQTVVKDKLLEDAT
jgi:hypothetical protein